MTDEQKKTLEKRRAETEQKKREQKEADEEKRHDFAKEMEELRAAHQRHIVKWQDEETGVQYKISSFSFRDDPYLPQISCQFDLEYGGQDKDGNHCRLSRGYDGEAYLLEWDATDPDFPFTPASVSYTIQQECMEKFLTSMRKLLQEILNCAIEENVLPLATIRPVK